MSELLLELFSEEIPARLQARGADDLRRLIVDGLKAQGLETGLATVYATPRRLTLIIDGVPLKSPDLAEEKKGPRAGAPEAAIAGFLKSAGLASINEAELVKDDKKGDYYIARINKPGRAAVGIIADVVPGVMAKFPWPKSMRWGSGTFAWIRPLQSIVCLLDGYVVPFEIAGLTSGATTRGHRFHGNEPFAVKDAADYVSGLAKRKVMIDPAARAATILEQARTLAQAAKLELVEDDSLAAENAGLTEWPVVMAGTFDTAFLTVPGECLTTSMKAHQKCFSLRNPKTKKLASQFILVSNLTATDGGKAIVSGNEKVIRARLSDAKFFWDQDLKRKLEPMHFELKGVTFHDKLGSQWARMERITELSRQIAGAVDAEPDLAGRAAQLAKADLVSGMVGEFPELQGLMGRYYAEAEHMNPKIARAIEEHYKPKGAGDSVPSEPVSVAVALADKLDTLVGFWAIGEKPTGSGDPFQLRRASLGVIRILLENDLRVRLMDQFSTASSLVRKSLTTAEKVTSAEWNGRRVEATSVDLLSFFADRLKVYLKDKGARHDLIDAVFALPGQDDLALVVKRVDALDGFLKSDDGANLLAGVKRAANILGIEEKKDKKVYSGEPNGALLVEPAERDLDAAIAKVKFDTKAAIDVENFDGAMRALSELRKPVDVFFEKVTVNDPDPALRENRLKMLSEIRGATTAVADFSKIAG
jgi:glycyl-tRNA synthetase beta chain